MPALLRSLRKVPPVTPEIIDLYRLHDCIACILIEMGTKEALMKHLLQHKLISHHEHGFLSRKSTSTQLLECCADWNVAMNTHNNIDAVYLDSLGRLIL